LKARIMTLGEKFKQFRTAKQFSLEVLAKKTNLTRSFLSQIEKNKTSPSISSLIKIADALSIPVSDLFREEKEFHNYIVHEDERESFSIDKNNLKVEILTPRRQEKKFEPVLLRFGVGGRTGVISFTGPFFCLILEGQVELSIGTDTHVLGKGDSIYLGSVPEHRWRNIGKNDVLAFAVTMTPLGRETIG
jgi:transcriptional regulator with XRE-family HTH domain